MIKRLIKERYRWLPYNYTLAWENAAMGLPLVRPLNFHTPGALSPSAGVQDEYLWGRDVLVAPVLTQGATSRTVTFPEGRWIDMARPDKTYTAADTIVYDAPLDVIPLFVRAGSFIPMADYAMENTGDYRTDRYLIKYYPREGVAGSFTMFEDNLTSTRSLADGAYTLLTFKGSDTPRELTIEVTKDGSYAGEPAKRSLTFEIFNVGDPASVILNGKPVARRDVNYDPTRRVLTVSVTLGGNYPATLTITKTQPQQNQ